MAKATPEEYEIFKQHHLLLDWPDLLYRMISLMPQKQFDALIQYIVIKNATHDEYHLE